MKINTNEHKENIIKTISYFSNEIDLNGIEEKFEKYFKGFGGKADIDKIYSFIFNILNENKLVIAVDWKWSIEDELYNIKNSVENFEYEVKDLDENEDFKVTCTLLVNNIPYELDNLDEYEFFDKVNDILEDINSNKRVLIVEGNTGDTLFYSIVPKDNYYDLVDNEYLPFVCF